MEIRTAYQTWLVDWGCDWIAVREFEIGPVWIGMKMERDIGSLRLLETIFGRSGVMAPWVNH